MLLMLYFIVGSYLVAAGLQLCQLSVTTTDVLALVLLYLVIDLYFRGGKLYTKGLYRNVTKTATIGVDE